LAAGPENIEIIEPFERQRGDGPRRVHIDLNNLPGDPQAVRRRIEMVEAVLERSLVLPGLNKPVGLDFIIGLIPVLGDIVTAAMGSYLLWEARNLGMSRFQIARMAANIGVDTALGAIPVVGDAFDLFYRSNTKNLRHIKRYLDKHHPQTRIIEG